MARDREITDRPAADRPKKAFAPVFSKRQP